MSAKRKAAGVRKTGKGSPAVCGQCMGIIDQVGLQRAARVGKEYVHECGRVLIRAR